MNSDLFVYVCGKTGDRYCLLNYISSGFFICLTVVNLKYIQKYVHTCITFVIHDSLTCLNKITQTQAKHSLSGKHIGQRH